ncbi:MAG TPA: FkbM family methyltransferase [Gemmataceae bacterium]|nr:FkbM family methyltransferase [Gemmataceae bacterium]
MGRTYPALVHRLLRWVIRSLPRFPKVWRLRHHALNVRSVRFRERLVRTRVLGGPSLWVKPNDLIGRHIFYDGVWEGSTTRHFYDGLRPGDVVLDVGANIGQYTVLAAKKVGPRGRVFAVEPGEETRRILDMNISTNGLSNVSIFSVAAWDADTELFLDVGEADNCGSAGVRVGPAERTTAATVPARRLGPLLRAAGCDRIDILKIDIEGAELPALRGLDDFFRDSPPRAVYCELLGGHPRFGASATDLFDFFDHHGYRARAFGDGGLTPFSRSQIGPDTMVNVLFELDRSVGSGRPFPPAGPS